MSKVVSLSLDDGLHRIDNIIHQCIEIFDKDENEEAKKGVSRICFNLNGCCNDIFLRELVLELKQKDDDVVVWREELSKVYEVSRVILVGPWELLDKFKNIVLSEQYHNFLYFQLDEMLEN